MGMETANIQIPAQVQTACERGAGGAGGVIVMDGVRVVSAKFPSPSSLSRNPYQNLPQGMVGARM